MANPSSAAGNCLALSFIVAPCLPRLKEWAYAGIVFELTGELHARR